MRYESYQCNSPFMGMGNNPVLLVDPLGGSVGETWTEAAQADYMANQIDASDDIVADFNYLQYGNYGPAGGGGYTTSHMDKYDYEVTTGAENAINNVTQGLMMMEALRQWVARDDYEPRYTTLSNEPIFPTQSGGDYFPGMPPPDGRPDLGRLGNWIRSKAGSDFSKDLFEHFWQGGGAIKLSDAQYQEVLNIAIDRGILNQKDDIYFVDKDYQMYTGRVVSFYGTKFERAFGSATIFFDKNNNPVGFYDYYNFDPKFYGRSFKNEMITEGIFYFSPRSAKPFSIVYGTFFVP